MARLARIVVPQTPHHVTQRGNRRMAIFSGASDYELYRDLLAERFQFHGVMCSAYCLMPNHVHLLLTPTQTAPLAASAAISRSVGEAHRRYTAFYNARARSSGHLFQGRFGCVAMDEAHWLTAVRYLALNPVQAGLCRDPRDWRWSSVGAHLRGRDDALVSVAPVLAVASRFDDLLEDTPEQSDLLAAFETATPNGRPLGGPEFLARIEARLGRSVSPGRRGRKPRASEAAG